MARYYVCVTEQSFTDFNRKYHLMMDIKEEFNSNIYCVFALYNHTNILLMSRE